jgi:hypothetical protein
MTSWSYDSAYVKTCISRPPKNVNPLKIRSRSLAMQLQAAHNKLAALFLALGVCG